jgi:hypothetical protein
MVRFLALPVAMALLSGCSGSSVSPAQSPILPLGVTRSQGGPLARSDTFSAHGPKKCAAWPGGSGILRDGDFHGAVLPETFQTYPKGDHFAAGWVVSRGTSDVVAPGDVNPPNGVCSIDLDGSSVGGIEHRKLRTHAGSGYTLSFLFSGNGQGPNGCPGPIVKKMRVHAGNVSDTLTWNVSNDNDAQHGVYQVETLGFTALSSHAGLRFTSLDKPKTSSCGPIIAAISVTENMSGHAP